MWKSVTITNFNNVNWIKGKTARFARNHVCFIEECEIKKYLQKCCTFNGNISNI